MSLPLFNCYQITLYAVSHHWYYSNCIYSALMYPLLILLIVSY